MTTPGTRWCAPWYFDHRFYLARCLRFGRRRRSRFILVNRRGVSGACGCTSFLFGIYFRFISFCSQAKMVFRIRIIYDRPRPTMAMPEFTYQTNSSVKIRTVRENFFLVPYHIVHIATCRLVVPCDARWQYLPDSRNLSSAKFH